MESSSKPWRGKQTLFTPKMKRLSTEPCEAHFSVILMKLGKRMSWKAESLGSQSEDHFRLELLYINWQNSECLNSIMIFLTDILTEKILN